MAVTLFQRPTQLRSGGTANTTPIGYCHDLTVTVLSDGSVNPSAFVLGNQGDINITRLTFDVSALETEHVIDPTHDYVLKMIIFNPRLPYSVTNPQSYIVDLNEWVVPAKILENGGDYNCVLSLVERMAGHTTPDNEVWISDQFICVVNPTLWSASIESALQNPIIYSDMTGYLMKPSVALNFSVDHYSVSATDDSIGNQRDVFVKRLELADNPLDEGFVYKYGIFITATNIYAVKFNEIGVERYACLIPKEITAVAGTYQYFIVATTEDVIDNPNLNDDGFKRWVGNTINFVVVDNFLNAEVLQLDTPAYIELSSNIVTFQMVDKAKSYDCIVDDTSIGSYSVPGFEFLSNGDGTCSVSYVGTYTDPYLEIPSLSPDGLTVTTIKSGSFRDNTNIVTVVIPDTITTIGNYVFYNCINLRTLQIGKGVTSIGGAILSGCSSLNKITIPFVGASSTTSSTSTVQVPFGWLFGSQPYTGGVATTQFIYNGQEHTVTQKTYYIPASLTSVKVTGKATDKYLMRGAFQNCSNLIHIEIDDNIDTIGQDAFNGCTAITDIHLPEHITTIQPGTFINCASLTNLVIPSGVTTIAYGSLNGCGALQSITIPFVGCSLLTDYPEYPFGAIFGVAEYTNAISISQTFKDATGSQTTVEYQVPQNLTTVEVATGDGLYSSRSIRAGAFSGCSNLIKVQLSLPQQTIPTSAFSGCINLKTIGLPLSLTSIQGAAFKDCQSLKEIIIPYNVTRISSGAFQNDSFDQIIALPTTPPALVSGSLPQGSVASILVPIDSVASYRGNRWWTWAVGDITSRITAIPPLDYQNHQVIGIGSVPSTTTSLVIPPVSPDGEYITRIGGDAFEYNNFLVDITIPEGVTEISPRAFYGCSALTNVSIPNSIQDVGQNAFGQCPNLPTTDLEDSDVKYLGNSENQHLLLLKFTNNSLTDYTIKTGTKVIAEGAFMGCATLTNINFSNDVEYIGNAAFMNCDGLTEVTLGNGVIQIGVAAFSHCDNLTEVILNNGISQIQPSAFRECPSLTSITIPDSIVTIPTNLCTECYALTSVNLGNNVKEIQDFAFFKCTALTTIQLPSNVTKIGPHAFQKCSALENILLPNGIQLMEEAFCECASLVSISIPNGTKYISDTSFDECDALREMIVDAINPPTFPVDSSSDIPYTIYVSNDRLNVYKTAEGWERYINRIQPSQDKININLSTLEGWASLVPGTHSLSIVAKAPNYIDSDPSPAITFTINE